MDSVDLHVDYIPYERSIVEFTDKLIEMNKMHGSHLSVEGDGDWKTIEFMYKGFKIMYPKSAHDFEKLMKFTQQKTLKNKGISKEGSAMLEYLLEVPAPLYHMMRVIFPMQAWNKEFVQLFKKHFPQMKAHV